MPRDRALPVRGPGPPITHPPRGPPKHLNSYIKIGISYSFSFLFPILSVCGSTLIAVFTKYGAVVTTRFTKLGTIY